MVEQKEKTIKIINSLKIKMYTPTIKVNKY